MKISLIICSLILLVISSCSYSQNCVDGINKLPLYGNGKIKKCPEQIKDDQEFISEEEKITTRKAAGAHMVMRGWGYMRKNELDTAIMRFNQAWLLDSLNAEIYWGLGDVLGMQNKFQESIPFFERALKMADNNPRIWQDASTSYGNTFYQTKDIKYLNLAIQALKNAIKLDPKNPQLFAQLTSAYSYFMQKDSAKKYLLITDKLDPNAISPQTRALLSNK